MMGNKFKTIIFRSITHTFNYVLSMNHNLLNPTIQFYNRLFRGNSIGFTQKLATAD